MRVVYVCLDPTYREVEGFAPAFLDETIDHSNVGKVFKRLRPGYVKLVLGLLRKRLKKHAEFDFLLRRLDGDLHATPENARKGPQKGKGARIFRCTRSLATRAKPARL